MDLCVVSDITTCIHRHALLSSRVLQRLPSAGYQGRGYRSRYERPPYHQRASRCCYRLWSRREVRGQATAGNTHLGGED
ncbi:hypothetical protein M405DRAFT_806515, partial [Rhizopogon salebrosus TDB-379]